MEETLQAAEEKWCKKKKSFISVFQWEVPYCCQVVFSEQHVFSEWSHSTFSYFGLILLSGDITFVTLMYHTCFFLLDLFLICCRVRPVHYLQVNFINVFDDQRLYLQLGLRLFCNICSHLWANSNIFCCCLFFILLFILLSFCHYQLLQFFCKIFRTKNNSDVIQSVLRPKPREALTTVRCQMY